MTNFTNARLPAGQAGAYVGLRLGGRYELESVLGRGGSAITFAALDLREGTKVAVKLLVGEHPLGTKSAFRLLQEVKITAGLRHPHIVVLKDWGIHSEDHAFLVMELLAGRTLDEELRQQKRLDATTTLSLLLPIAGAVAYAHDARVLHRDLKPQNIILGRTDTGDVCPKLLDFGIAKDVEALTLTNSGVVLGTPAFMSPEQAHGASLTPASDVWSLGVVFFNCLTGRLPFGNESTTQTLLDIVSGKPPVMERSKALDPKLCAVIEHAIHRGRRYADMRSFVRQLLFAAVEAGLEVPADPDPVGLPFWRSWLDETKRGNAPPLDTAPIQRLSQRPSVRPSEPAPKTPISEPVRKALSSEPVRKAPPSEPMRSFRPESPRSVRPSLPLRKIPITEDITFDASTRPIVVITWPDVITDASVDSFIVQLDAFVADWRRSYGIVHRATTPMSPITMNPRVRARLAAYSAEMRPRDEGILKGIAYVSTSAMARGLITAIHWVAPKYFPIMSFDVDEPAIRWLTEKLNG